MAGFNFGTPTTSTPFALGSNTTTGAPAGFSFGATTPSSTTQTLQFNAPTSTPGGVSFGTPAATGGSGFTFGGPSNLTPSTQSSSLAFKPGLTFGSPATTQPTLGFGSPATSTSTGLTFGSTPVTTQQTLSFGNMPTSTQPSLSFGSAPTTSQPLSFGSTPATTQPIQSFGLSAPATTASAGLTLGAPAATTTGLSFGLGSTATTKPTLSFGTPTSAVATSTPSLLSFSTPKTSAPTGFSLSVSAGTGTAAGSLFNLPTTSAPTTTTASTVFKGLGGVDTTTNQGSAKDTKSVKENIVNPEIMQTLDTFKNFVKQQKNLSCEVSRAPVKPMHKVTEDTEALNKLLTSVSSALQKNRVAANKLKNDTTKCLSLCEMAQRTHDTPPGLQNDNIAPLEFFIHLVSKFERDIQILRQEIDNTEKHVNSLSYPAILTPQELSTALRRLHDSFVALAGRLQAAHAGVTAQKERHLSLRRHFLKDHTNIFETSVRSTVPKKHQCPMPIPMPGPTPFSSIGGLPNISLMAGQDKTVTFSTGTSSRSGWGSSNVSSLNPNSTSTFLQSPGTSILSSPQSVDNQNFQLGKPPPGNKRGKR